MIRQSSFFSGHVKSEQRFQCHTFSSVKCGSLIASLELSVFLQLINKIICLSSFDIRNVGKTHKYLDKSSTERSFTHTNLLLLENGNALLYSLPNNLFACLQCLQNTVLSPLFWNNYTGSLSLKKSSSIWCSMSNKYLTAKLPTISQKYFKFTLHQGIFDPVPLISSKNPTLDMTSGVTGLFLWLELSTN